MKHWVWYAAALLILSAVGLAPFQGTDVAQLQPVELLQISQTDGKVLVQTDTGDSGRGDTLAAAFDDLEATVSGHVFLETAEYLLITPKTAAMLPELTQRLRPACSVCFVYGGADLEKAAKFLSAHKPQVTLQDVRAGEERLPVLVVREEEMRLVS